MGKSEEKRPLGRPRYLSYMGIREVHTEVGGEI